MADTIMPNIFTDAYINYPRMISEIILNNEVLGGTLTFPVISEDETEEPKIYTIPFYLEENFSFSLVSSNSLVHNSKSCVLKATVLKSES